MNGAEGGQAKAVRQTDDGQQTNQARFTARFVNIAASVDVISNWSIILKSEYRTHTHLNCGATHTRVKDIPVDGEVARSTSLLADARSSTNDVEVFL
ncbi:hypothetical protein GN244_ATG06162 [Phytophthora infestans]|uniref:Uncharacterized protein n=1 Tax=Phytophthora infestans TaxID=4787 RepID=A0A833WM29_PHYIN|nr:hypothetical protein GN244_ATG06162 [Phytophthora infestans]